MPDINNTLTERGKTHGSFETNALVAQRLKAVIRNLNETELSVVQMEALDFITSKIGRICSGNPNEPDHWIDIAGYATLVAKSLTESKPK